MANPTGPKFDTEQQKHAYFSDLAKCKHARHMQVSREALQKLSDVIAEAAGEFTDEQRARADAIIRRGSKNIAPT